MKSSELRIGNYVSVMGSLPHEVTSYHLYMMDTYIPKDPKEADYEEMTQPIALTSEWLLKFGFKEGYRYGDCGDVDFAHDEFAVRFENNTYTAYIWSGLGDYDSYGYAADLEYVHQLQNLYFALTGQELTLKEGNKP